jgi:pimeloyl-ACP methyl ester carboxylesterase
MAVVWMLVGLLVAIAVAAILIAGYFLLATRRIAKRAERLVPPGGRFVEVEGCRIHYVERGAGRPVLLIHGLGGHHHHMRRPLMEALGSDQRLIAIDRPGSGWSTRPVTMTGRLDEQARLVAAFIDALGLDRPLVVGHSLGGAIALALALDHPDKVAGLALISPLTHFDPDPPPEFKAMAVYSPLRRRLLAHTLAVPMSLRNASKTLDFVFGPQQAPEDYAVEGGGMLGLRPGHLHATITDLVAIEHDLARYEARYEEIEVPVGIIFGTADRVLDVRQHGLPMAGRIPRLELELLEGTGHMPQYVETDRVASFVRRMADRAFA